MLHILSVSYAGEDKCIFIVLIGYGTPQIVAHFYSINYAFLWCYIVFFGD